MRSLCFAAALLLSGCASAPTFNVAAGIGLAQADYPVIKAAAKAYTLTPGANESAVVTINNTIATTDPLFAALNPAISTQANVVAVLQAMSTLILTPAGQSTLLSPNTKADIANAVALAQGVATVVSLF